MASKDEAIAGLREVVSELKREVRRRGRRERGLAHQLTRRDALVAALRRCLAQQPAAVPDAVRVALAPSPGAWAEVSRRQDRAEEEQRMRAELDTANRRIVALTAEVDGLQAQVGRIPELERRLAELEGQQPAVPDVWRELEEP